MTQQEVLLGLRGRDPRALEDAITLYGPSVYALIWRVIGGNGSREDLEECVSDTFLAVWSRIGEYEEARGSFKTWILILAKYKALDYRRKVGGAPQEYRFDEQSGCLPPFERAQSASTFNVEKQVLLREDARELREAMNDMPPLDRILLLKRYWLYQPLNAIANETGLTRKSVENRLRRSRNQLRDKLNGKEGMQ